MLTLHGVPDVPFTAGDAFRTMGGMIIQIARVSGRGRNRAAHVAQFDGGVRVLRYWNVVRLRSYLKREESSPTFDVICRVCGCTNDDCIHCVELTGDSCHWVEGDLCSACSEVRIPAAGAAGAAAKRAGKLIGTCPHEFSDDFPNDLRDAWRNGWVGRDHQKAGRRRQAVKP